MKEVLISAGRFKLSTSPINCSYHIDSASCTWSHLTVDSDLLLPFFKTRASTSSPYNNKARASNAEVEESGENTRLIIWLPRLGEMLVAATLHCGEEAWVLGLQMEMSQWSAWMSRSQAREVSPGESKTPSTSIGGEGHLDLGRRIHDSHDWKN